MRELALHILDLVQNSLEAKAGKVWLYVAESSDADTITIRIADNGRGMNQETVRSVRDPFVTTRTTRRVGLGLPLIDMTAQRCNGSLDIRSDIGHGTTVTAVFQHSHLDRPPLGDMAATVKSILVANTELDFSYLHTVDGRTFSITSAELADNLGDIPLCHPEVLQWLDGYLAAGIANLYGGAGNENTGRSEETAGRTAIEKTGQS